MIALISRINLLKRSVKEKETHPTISVFLTIVFLVGSVVYVIVTMVDYGTNVRQSSTIEPNTRSYQIDFTCQCAYGCLVIFVGSCSTEHNTQTGVKFGETAGLFVCAGSDEFVIIGTNVSVTTTLNQKVNGLCLNNSVAYDGAQLAGILSAYHLGLLRDIKNVVSTQAKLAEELIPNVMVTMSGTITTFKSGNYITPPLNLCQTLFPPAIGALQYCYSVHLYPLVVTTTEYRLPFLTVVGAMGGMISLMLLTIRIVMRLIRLVNTKTQLPLPLSPVGTTSV